jgi:hypothetical protein
VTSRLWMGKLQTFFHSEDVHVMTIWQKRIGPDFRQFYAREGRILNLFKNFSEKSLKGDLLNDTTDNPPLFSLVNTLKQWRPGFTARDGVHLFTFLTMYIVTFFIGILRKFACSVLRHF